MSDIKNDKNKQSEKNNTPNIFHEIRSKIHETIREGSPLFAKGEDKYVELRDFLKDYTHAPAKKFRRTIQEEEGELHKHIRDSSPLFTQIEDGYVEVKAFLKDVSKSLHIHLESENKKPIINSLETKAKRFHAPKQDEIKK